MNFKDIKIYLLILTSILVISCDLDDRILELEEHESRLVIDAQITQVDTSMAILITESQSIADTIFEYENTKQLNNVSLQLMTPDEGIIDGFIFGYTRETERQNLAFWKFEYFDFLESESYTLVAKADGLETISAEVIVPTKPSIKELDVSFDNGSSGDFIVRDKFELTISDRPNQENYYLLEATITYSNDEFSFESEYRFYDLPNNPIDESFLENRIRILEDKTFDGRDYKITLYGERQTNYDIENVAFNLYEITENYYNYIDQFDKYNNENPFSEPITFPNNIENGYGIFTITSKPDVKTISF